MLLYASELGLIGKDHGVSAAVQEEAGSVGQRAEEQRDRPGEREDGEFAQVIQGYNGLAVVDERTQIVVHAEAHGSGYEAHQLAPLLEATRATFADLDPSSDVLSKVKVTADSGFHSRVIVAEVEKTGADACIADRDYRRRAPLTACPTWSVWLGTRWGTCLRRAPRAGAEPSLSFDQSLPGAPFRRSATAACGDRPPSCCGGRPSRWRRGRWGRRRRGSWR